MNNIRELLREADPLRLEATYSQNQREASRRVVLSAAVRHRPPAQARVRSRPWIGALALAAGFILLALLGLRVWSPLITEVRAAVRFEVRLAETAPAPGLREYKVPGSDRSVYLYDQAIVSNADIAAARVIRGATASEYNVEVTFTATGAGKMRAATGKHIGKPVAILIDGQVIMVPTVRTAIGETAVITGDLTRAQAERIAKGIQGR